MDHEPCLQPDGVETNEVAAPPQPSEETSQSEGATASVLSLFGTMWKVTKWFLAFYMVVDFALLFWMMLPIPECNGTNCVIPMATPEDDLDVLVYAVRHGPHHSRGKPIWKAASIRLGYSDEATVNVSIPSYVRTAKKHEEKELDIEVVLRLASGRELVKERRRLTTWLHPRVARKKSLVGGSNSSSNNSSEWLYAAAEAGHEVMHWRSAVHIRMSDFAIPMSRDHMINDILPWRYFRGPTWRYTPYIVIDDLETRRVQWIPLSRNVSAPPAPLQIKLTTDSITQLRIQILLDATMKGFSKVGMGEAEVFELQDMLMRRKELLLLETVLGLVHSFLAYLTFKNDVKFWKETRSRRGLSGSSVVLRFVMQLAIYLYLSDYENINRIVLVVNGISLAIEAWKVKRIFRVTLSWAWFKGLFAKKAGQDCYEEETDRYDAECMRFLSWLVFPSLTAYSIYLLFTEEHKGWYSWLVTQFAYAAYLFGFMSMVPQLYINYKLKTVEFLPWRAMVYKAFVTLVDDVFAFVANVPWSYRVSVFGNDITFAIMLFQMYLYRKPKATEATESTETTKATKATEATEAKTATAVLPESAPESVEEPEKPEPAGAIEEVASEPPASVADEEKKAADDDDTVESPEVVDHVENDVDDDWEVVHHATLRRRRPPGGRNED